MDKRVTYLVIIAATVFILFLIYPPWTGQPIAWGTNSTKLPYADTTTKNVTTPTDDFTLLSNPYVTNETYIRRNFADVSRTPAVYFEAEATIKEKPLSGGKRVKTLAVLAYVEDFTVTVKYYLYRIDPANFKLHIEDVDIKVRVIQLEGGVEVERWKTLNDQLSITNTRSNLGIVEYTVHLEQNREVIGANAVRVKLTFEYLTTSGDWETKNVVIKLR